jgi:hypothetical protein
MIVADSTYGCREAYEGTATTVKLFVTYHQQMPKKSDEAQLILVLHALGGGLRLKKGFPAITY